MPGLASQLACRWCNQRWSSSVQHDEARAEQLLIEALETDANNGWAHGTMGLLRQQQNRLAESKIEWETAIALNRNDAFAFRQLGITLMYLGQPDAAIPQIEKGIQLSPHDNIIFQAYFALGMCHQLLGHLDEAIDFLRKARAANPRIYVFHLHLAGALGVKGEIEEARAVLLEAIKLKPEINSLARWRTYRPALSNPQYRALAEKTVDVGLRRAGFPDE